MLNAPKTVVVVLLVCACRAAFGPGASDCATPNGDRSHPVTNPVTLIPFNGKFYWQATGDRKGFPAYLVEYRTGKR